MRDKWLLAGAVVVLAAIASTALFWTHRKPQVVAPQPVSNQPAAAPASPPAPVEIALAGEIQAAHVVNVPPAVDGTIEQFMAEVGDVVIEGKLLARIKNPKLASDEAAAQLEAERARNRISEIEAALIAARLEVSRSQADQARVKIELDRAQKEFEKQQFMFKQGITARLVFEKSQEDYNALKTNSETVAEAAKNGANRVFSLTTDLENARHDLDQQKASLDESRAESAAGDVRSPAEGIIVARCCQVGESVSVASTSLFQIAGDLTSLQVAATADSATIERIHPGQSAVIEIANFTATISGTVREAKLQQVIIDFTSPSPAVRPGMTAQVKIKVS